MTGHMEDHISEADEAKRRIDFIQDLGLARTLADEAPSSARENAAVKDAPRHDDQLEAGIEDSFPASDPLAVTQPAKPPKGVSAAADDFLEVEDPLAEQCDPAEEACLDESLAESFPASDPPSMTQPAGEMVGAPPRPKPEPDGIRVAEFLKPPA